MVKRGESRGGIVERVEGEDRMVEWGCVGGWGDRTEACGGCRIFRHWGFESGCGNRRRGRLKNIFYKNYFYRFEFYTQTCQSIFSYYYRENYGKRALPRYMVSKLSTCQLDLNFSYIIVRTQGFEIRGKIKKNQIILPFRRITTRRKIEKNFNSPCRDFQVIFTNTL